MGAGTYGITVFRNAVDLRSDGGPRVELVRGYRVVDRWRRKNTPPRGKIRAWSLSSAKRLAIVALNADVAFASHITLTYRARSEAWETDAARNLRIVKSSKADLHRFLRCTRRELGDYLWVQEFQARGVIHYHVLTTREATQARMADAWARASGQDGDLDVLRHGVCVDSIRSQEGARHYLGRYLGKERQKRLPEGIDGAGRWWGRSRSLKLAVLEEVVWMDRADGVVREEEKRIVRILRGYIRRKFGWRYKGARFWTLAGGCRRRWPSWPRGSVRTMALEGDRERRGAAVHRCGWEDLVAKDGQSVWDGQLHKHHGHAGASGRDGSAEGASCAA